MATKKTAPAPASASPSSSPAKKKSAAKPSAPSASTVTASPLETALGGYFAAYARHFLTGDRPLPAFRAALSGTTMTLVVEAPDGPQTVRRRANAYLFLAGDFWGAAQGPAERALLPTLVATLSAHPGGGSNAWNNFHEFQHDPAVLAGLVALAEALQNEPNGETDAVLLLRAFLEIDGHDYYAKEAADKAPKSLRSAVGKRAKLLQQSEIEKATTPQAVLKRILPFAGSSDPIERLAAPARVSDVLPRLSMSNHLAFHELNAQMLPGFLSEGDGVVHQVGLSIAQELSAKLVKKRAYAEAKPLLDLVIAAQIALPESLRLRWECRLYLGEPDADEDRARAASLDEPSDPSSMGPCWFWQGDVKDREHLVRARVAAALVIRAKGGDPCEDRRITKKHALTQAQSAALLDRAKALAETSVADATPRIEADLARARAEGEARGRGFQSEEFVARAKVREASGDLVGALRDYEQAREVRVASGLSWQSDSFGEEIRRLGRAVSAETSPAPLPPCFEPLWLADPARTSEERAEAIAAWSQQPWRAFPETPEAARGTAYAYVLLSDLVADSANVWEIAEQQGVALGDRLAFVSRARPFLDRWVERRDAGKLESVLEGAHQLAFFGDRTRYYEGNVRQQRALLAWVNGVVAAETIDDRAVLTGLEGLPWDDLRACFDAKGADLDDLRELFDGLVRAGLTGDEMAIVLPIYRELGRNDWSGYAEPKPPFAKACAKLASIDPGKLAPALIAWTRSEQQKNGYYGPRRFNAKWLWPLRWAWDEAAMRPFLAEVKGNRLDGGKPLSKNQRATRLDCLAWLETAHPTP